MFKDKLKRAIGVLLLLVVGCGSTTISSRPIFAEDSMPLAYTASNEKAMAIEKTVVPKSEIKAVKVPILMFHDLTANGPSKGATIHIEEFENVLKYLRTYGYNTITLTELHGYLSGTVKTLPEKPIILTFDDGYYSNYEYAFPLLKQYDMKAVISVIGWSIGKDELIKDVLRKTTIKTNGKIVKHFGEKEMLEMVSSGHVEIQNHTYDLHNEYGLSYGYNEPSGKGVGKLKGESFNNYEMRLSRDLIYLNETIKMKTGMKPTFVAYPYGYYIPDTEKIIKKIGFAGSMTIKKGIRTYKNLSDLYEMPRIEIKVYQDLLQLKVY